MFLAPEKGSYPTTFYHAFHHTFTIKKPPSNTHFFHNPLKKASKDNKIPRHPAVGFFPKKNSPHSILSRNRLRQQLLHQLRNLMHQCLMRRRIRGPRKPCMHLPNPPITP